MEIENRLKSSYFNIGRETNLFAYKHNLATILFPHHFGNSTIDFNEL